jgi:hypothetical protein
MPLDWPWRFVVSPISVIDKDPLAAPESRVAYRLLAGVCGLISIAAGPVIPATKSCKDIGQDEQGCWIIRASKCFYTHG